MSWLFHIENSGGFVQIELEGDIQGLLMDGLRQNLNGLDSTQFSFVPAQSDTLPQPKPVLPSSQGRAHFLIEKYLVAQQDFCNDFHKYFSWIFTAPVSRAPTL